jgi:hypothetical protein
VTRVKPLAPDRFALQVTISQETRDKLERAQALLRHRHPSGDLAEILDRALDALLARLEKEKLGATARPRATRARKDASDPRYVPPAVKRAVCARDGERCAFTSETGERCTERGFLEFDHVTPVAHGGRPTVDGTRVLCHAHNKYEAERILGADVVRARRAAAIAARAAAVTGTAAAAATGTAAAAATGTAAVATGEDAPTSVTSAAAFDADVTLALRGMGFKADETRRAMADTARAPATTFEMRLRSALAELMRPRGFRCSEGLFDRLASRWNAASGCG